MQWERGDGARVLWIVVVLSLGVIGGWACVVMTICCATEPLCSSGVDDAGAVAVAQVLGKNTTLLALRFFCKFG